MTIFFAAPSCEAVCKFFLRVGPLSSPFKANKAENVGQPLGEEHPHTGACCEESCDNQGYVLNEIWEGGTRASRWGDVVEVIMVVMFMCMVGMGCCSAVNLRYYFGGDVGVT